MAVTLHIVAGSDCWDPSVSFHDPLERLAVSFYRSLKACRCRLTSRPVLHVFCVGIGDQLLCLATQRLRLSIPAHSRAPPSPPVTAVPPPHLPVWLCIPASLFAWDWISPGNWLLLSSSQRLLHLPVNPPITGSPIVLSPRLRGINFPST